MAFKLADFVKETTTSTGTGSIALDGAATGYQAFSAKMSIGDTTTYSIRAVDVTGAPTGEWELVGGTYTGVNTLSRDTVLASSNSDAAVSFSAGTKEVYITMPSARASWIRTLADRLLQVEQKGSAPFERATKASGLGDLFIKQFDANRELFEKTRSVRLEIKAAGDAITTTSGRAIIGGGVGAIAGGVLGLQNALMARPAPNTSAVEYSRYTGQSVACRTSSRVVSRRGCSSKVSPLNVWDDS